MIAVLSKALRYAATARVIDHAPSVGLLKPPTGGTDYAAVSATEIE